MEQSDKIEVHFFQMIFLVKNFDVYDFTEEQKDYIVRGKNLKQLC
jgi:hypothetical protein